MVDWLRFALIVAVIAVDDILRELGLCFVAIRDFFMNRVRWIFVEKARSVWRGFQR